MTVDLPTYNRILYYIYGQKQMWAKYIWMHLCNIYVYAWNVMQLTYPVVTDVACKQSRGRFSR